MEAHMRSRIKTSIIVLLVTSAASGSAMAATPQDNIINHVAATQTQPCAIKVVRSKAKAEQPRLKQILVELRLQNRRLSRDRRQGLLTDAAYQQLKAQRNQIREKAVHVANRHAGKLPLRPYIALQTSIKALNTDIRHKLSA